MLPQTKKLYIDLHLNLEKIHCRCFITCFKLWIELHSFNRFGLWTTCALSSKLDFVALQLIFSNSDALGAKYDQI